MEDIYRLINRFRESPQAFVAEHGWRSACTRPLSVSYDPLVVLPELEDAARFQALECNRPMTHRTCDQHCHLFGSCSYIDRIDYFLPDATNEQEVLVYGPRHPMKWLVQSQGHCDHILNPSVNSMGGVLVENYFLLSMAECE